jgi:hypothetical protein
MADQETQDLLDRYARERGNARGSLTVAQLISSHRVLVDELNEGHRKEWREGMLQAQARGEEAAKKEALEKGYLSVGRLRGMYVGELALWLEGVACEHP